MRLLLLCLMGLLVLLLVPWFGCTISTPGASIITFAEQPPRVHVEDLVICKSNRCFRLLEIYDDTECVLRYKTFSNMAASSVWSISAFVFGMTCIGIVWFELSWRMASTMQDYYLQWLTLFESVCLIVLLLIPLDRKNGPFVNAHHNAAILWFVSGYLWSVVYVTRHSGLYRVMNVALGIRVLAGSVVAVLLQFGGLSDMIAEIVLVACYFVSCFSILFVYYQFELK
jgi:hypothetical protein